MKLQDLAKPQQTKQVAKVMESYFGQSVSFDSITKEQAQQMLRKVRGLLAEHRQQHDFHSSEQNPAYLKLVMMEQGLSARIAEGFAAQGAAMLNATRPGGATGSMPTTTPTSSAQAAATKALQAGAAKPAATLKTTTNPSMFQQRSALRPQDIGYTPQQKRFVKPVTPATTTPGATTGATTGVTTEQDAQTMSPAQQAALAAQQQQQARRQNQDQMKQIDQQIKQLQAQRQQVQKQMSMPMTENSRLTESEVQQAQVVLASQDMVDQVQKMIEQVTSMQFKDLPALVDQIKSQVGQDQAGQFNTDATAALSGLVQNLQGSKQQLESALGVVTGQAPVVPGEQPGAELGAELPPEGGEGDLGAELDQIAADTEEEPAEQPRRAGLGRERR